MPTTDGDRRVKAMGKLAVIKHGKARAVLDKPGRSALSDNQLVTLSNMWHERAKDILIRCYSGESFSAAEKHSQGIYDTCCWGEVCRRLALGRGDVLVSAARLARQGSRIAPNAETVEELVRWADSIHRDTNDLLHLLEQVPIEGVGAGRARTAKSTNDPIDAAAPVTFARVNAQLKQCGAFVAKCKRDMPLIAGKTGHMLTPAEQTKINLRANRILIGAQLVSFVCRNDLLGTVTKPVRTRDPYGIGQRYAKWLDPLIDQMRAN